MKKLGIGLMVTLSVLVIGYMCIMNALVTGNTTNQSNGTIETMGNTKDTTPEWKNCSILGTTEHPCTVVLSVGYSKNAPDISLISPNNKIYGKNTTECEYTDSGKVITVKVSTAETGTWSIGYGDTSGKLKIDFSTTDIEEPVITDVEPIIKKGSMSVKFKVLYGDGITCEKIAACIIMSEERLKCSNIVVDTTVYTNETVNVNCDVSNLKTSNEWKLSIIVHTEKDGSICDSHFTVKPVKYEQK